MFKLGSSGKEVSAIQQLLANVGFSPGVADGKYGPKTVAAVKKYQEMRGLAVDGNVGPVTWRDMFPTIPYPEAPVRPDSPIAIKQERFLAELGCFLMLVLGERYPDLVERLSSIGKKQYLQESEHMMAGEMLRTEEQQRIYVQQGLSATMNSRHLKRLAIDLYCIKNGSIVSNSEAMGELWESLDPEGENVWGGRWKVPYDPNHFEKKP